jgi:hypothetical protein
MNLAMVAVAMVVSSEGFVAGAKKSGPLRMP